MKKLAVLLAATLGCISVSADIFHVSTHGTSIVPFSSWSTAATNIQDAVNVATNSGDLVLITNGTFRLAAEVAVSNAMKIVSVYGPAATVVIAVHSNRCFNLAAGVFLGGFTLTNGYTATDGGGVFSFDASTIVSNCIFAGNTAGDEGGGMYRGTAYDCDFMGNDSLNDGGGSWNVAAYNCNYIGNTAVGNGGGFVASANPATADNCVFIGNAAKYGGGIFEAPATDCVFSNNIASTSGGAMYRSGTANNCIFVGNVASNKSGGAVTRTYASNCIFSNNWANLHGGAMFESGASNCTFIGNHAGVNGGAKSYWNLVMQDCVFISNTADARGGAVNEGQLYNCIFYGNYSHDRGGATSEAHLYNCVLYNNSANNQGGGISLGSAQNSILWSNAAPIGSDFYNATLNSCYTADPSFMDAANGDFHLQAGSPCIDAGSNALITVFFDHEGVPRPLDSDTNGTAIVDIGCYEILIATADSDGDTMPDGWENDHELNPTLDDAAGNLDGDFFNNGDEYIADTDPADSNDWFRITDMTLASPATVWFRSSDARQYTLQTCTNLVEGVWSNMMGPVDIMGNGGLDSLTGPSTTNHACFYRVQVEIPLPQR